MKVLNLTQHPATQEQVAVGVYEPANKDNVKKLLTFNSLPSQEEIQSKAQLLAIVAVSEGAEYAMIGGAGYLMPMLEQSLKEVGIKPLHAFSERVSVEEVQPDGSVVKKNVFRHVGFVGL